MACTVCLCRSVRGWCRKGVEHLPIAALHQWGIVLMPTLHTVIPICHRTQDTASTPVLLLPMCGLQAVVAGLRWYK